ncbi:ATP-binding protein [Tepidibacillus infernus]|uniref:ATP-binding protein n=1 Tax=Tepidibacillus infernus TaxID=1806172 RepID=UPI003A3669FC
MKKIHLRLQTKIIILSMAFILIVILILGIVSSMMITSNLERKIGENALNIAKTTAIMPAIHQAFKMDDPSKVIQPLAEKIRKEVGAEFVVIGNKEGIRYSHPYLDRLGKKMVGGDNDPVLKEGRAIISSAVGTLGLSLRGKAPIFDETKQVIGVVSVGFLMEDIKDREKALVIKMIVPILLVILIGIAGSFFLSWNIKKDIFGLEPEEISQLFLEREALLESVKEGIIAVDKQGKITVINETAKKILDHKNQKIKFIGKPIQEVLANTKIIEVLNTGKAQYDEEMLIGDEWVITNRVPMIVKGKVIGAVASFRRKMEIDRLLQELSDHKVYLDTLRAQNHEFTNKLYTISGLLQLGKIQEAISFITDETVQQDDMIAFLMEHIYDPKLSAFFIGKLTRAEEQKVQFVIDSNTHLQEELHEVDIEDLITIYGNLIENALDSVRNQDKENKRIIVLLQNREQKIFFRIEDWGTGIPDEIKEKIFKDGFTTKGDSRKRGIGLALVDTLVKKYHGKIFFYQPDHQGVVFEVELTKPMND